MKIKINTIWNKFKEVFIFLTIVVLLSVFVDMSVISSANEEEEDPYAEFECYAETYAAVEEADIALMEFYTDVMTSEYPSSELLDILLTEYGNYVDTLEAALSAATATSPGDQLTVVDERIDGCRTLVNQHMEANLQILETQFAASAAAKKTTTLIDEYQWINERLRDMNEMIGKYQGYLTKMKDNLPGFTKNCVKN